MKPNACAVKEIHDAEPCIDTTIKVGEPMSFLHRKHIGADFFESQKVTEVSFIPSGGGILTSSGKQTLKNNDQLLVTTEDGKQYLVIEDPDK